jgi:aspartate aminotransferase
MNTHFKPARLSSRLSAVRPSPTIAITRLANELRRQGRDVIGLSQGEPDFDTPLHVKRAAKDAIDADATKYTDVDGTPELKRAITGKFKSEIGLSYEERWGQPAARSARCAAAKSAMLLKRTS